MPIPAFLICPLLLFFAWSEASRPLLWIPADSSLAPQWHRQILSAVESGLGPEWECSAQRLREPAATLRTVLRRQRERLQLIVEIEYGPAFRTDRLGTSLDSAHQDSLSLQRTVALAGTDAVAALRDAFSKADNTSEDSLPSPLPPGRLRVEWLDSLSGAVWVDGELRCAGLTLCEVSENNGLHWIAMRRNEFDLSPMWVRLPSDSPSSPGSKGSNRCAANREAAAMTTAKGFAATVSG